MAKLGFSQVDITPPIGTTLSGYECERISEGVHDELFARTLLIDFEGELFCIVQMDLIGIDEHFIEKIFHRVKDLGIKKDNLIACTTHTHSGPKGIFDETSILDEESFGFYNYELVSDYVNKVEKCIRAAFDDMMPLERMEVGSSYVQGIGSERHVNTEGDGRVFVMKLIREDGKKVLLYNFSCHPTILHHDNLLISSDLPYGVLKYFGNSYDMIMFTNGSAGDISTRFTRQSTTFEEVDRIGKELGKAIENAIKDPIYSGSINYFKTKRYRVSLKFRDIHSVEEANRRHLDAIKKVEEAKIANLPPSEMRLVESLFEGTSRDLKIAKTMKRREYLELEINIFRINDWNFITIPGEIFSNLSKPIRETDNNIILGYTNGYYLYFPDEKAWEKNYYEASSSYVKKGEGERLVSIILSKLNEDFSNN